jgi:hypothetical protein
MLSPCRLQVRRHVEDDPVGILPLADLLADFLEFQLAAVLRGTIGTARSATLATGPKR